VVISKALKDEKIPVYGNGLNVRDWIHVYDHCSAIEFIVRKSSAGEIYNVGSSNEIRNIDLVKKLLSTLNKPLSLIEYVEDRLGHDARYSVESKKLRALGWKPVYSLEDFIYSL
jgi:dTDP-glucose 4,6-dehydratase